MPSLIGYTGYNGLGGAAANYLKAQPSTQFGTRQLSVLTITKAGLTDGAGSELASNSLYSKVVRALQQTAEVWAIFEPVNDTTDYFNVIISTDSQWTGTGAPADNTPGGKISDDTFTALENALNTGAGTTGIVVSVTSGFTAPFHG